MGELPRVIAHGERALVDEVPDARQVGPSLAGSVYAGASAGTVAQFLVAALHRTSGIVEMVLDAISATDATQRCFPIQSCGLQQCVPQAMPPGAVFAGLVSGFLQ